MARGTMHAPKPEDQRRALAAYLGLISFMDAQVGRVLDALEAAGLRDTTRILYTSDHGENAGKRGFWGKSNHYQEAVAIPLIVAGEGVPAGKVSATPASLADAYPSVLDCVGLSADGDDVPGRSLFALANAPEDRERIVFSEYHAAGSPSASSESSPNRRSSPRMCSGASNSSSRDGTSSPRRRETSR